MSTDKLSKKENKKMAKIALKVPGAAYHITNSVSDHARAGEIQIPTLKNGEFHGRTKSHNVGITGS